MISATASYMSTLLPTTAAVSGSNCPFCASGLLAPLSATDVAKVAGIYNRAFILEFDGVFQVISRIPFLLQALPGSSRI